MSQAVSPPVALIESLDHEGQGVARVDGKAIFIEGALPGERVEYSSYRKKASFEKARAGRILKASSLRVTPRCPNYNACGGCSMQHLDSNAQASVKQRVLEDALWHIGRLQARGDLSGHYRPGLGLSLPCPSSRCAMWQKKGGTYWSGFHASAAAALWSIWASARYCRLMHRH